MSAVSGDVNGGWRNDGYWWFLLIYWQRKRKQICEAIDLTNCCNESVQFVWMALMKRYSRWLAQINDFNRQLFLRLVISSSGHFLFVAINSFIRETAKGQQRWSTRQKSMQVKVVHCKYECLRTARSMSSDDDDDYALWSSLLARSNATLTEQIMEGLVVVVDHKHDDEHLGRLVALAHSPALSRWTVIK